MKKISFFIILAVFIVPFVESGVVGVLPTMFRAINLFPVVIMVGFYVLPSSKLIPIALTSAVWRDLVFGLPLLATLASTLALIGILASLFYILSNRPVVADVVSVVLSYGGYLLVLVLVTKLALKLNPATLEYNFTAFEAGVGFFVAGLLFLLLRSVTIQEKRLI